MDQWTIDHEKRAVAQEIEEGTRVAVHDHLENRSPFQVIHIEELAKMAQRQASIKEGL